MNQERVRHLFDYDPESGLLTWKNPKYPAYIGREVGAKGDKGYRIVTVDGRIEYVHRVIWVHAIGDLPETIDHKNRDKSDNRLANLRAASRSQNNANRPMSKKADLPHGVCRVSYSSTFRASIKVNRKTIHLGSFATADEAANAYQTAAVTHFGEFALSA